MSDHGKVQNIYRIINEEHVDLDLTRTQAIRVYRQLRTMLYPRAKRSKPSQRRLKVISGMGRR